MDRITVKTSGEYEVLSGFGLIKRVPELILPFCPTKRVLIVTDDIVDVLYGKELKDLLIQNGFEVFKFVFKNGEQSKNIFTLSNILEFAAGNGLHRNDTFIALGGGVVGDITGLASALFMRGTNVIQIPTTLLSAVDSSVGGKTAVDLKNGKNSAGVFKQPCLVICDTDIIKNLPDDIFCEGMAEVIKCNVIKNVSVFEKIENDTVLENLTQIIKECITLKRDIVEKDEFDTLGLRNLLNAGHTIAHAIELLSDYTVSHGIAVGTGLCVEADIAVKLGLCGRTVADRIKNAVLKYGLLRDFPYSAEQIATACLKDKKNKDRRILFLLPDNIGHCAEIRLSKDELQKLL